MDFLSENRVLHVQMRINYVNRPGHLKGSLRTEEAGAKVLGIVKAGIDT